MPIRPSAVVAAAWVAPAASESLGMRTTTDDLRRMRRASVSQDPNDALIERYLDMAAGRASLTAGEVRTSEEQAQINGYAQRLRSSGHNRYGRTASEADDIKRYATMASEMGLA